MIPLKVKMMALATLTDQLGQTTSIMGSSHFSIIRVLPRAHMIFSSKRINNIIKTTTKALIVKNHFTKNPNIS